MDGKLNFELFVRFLPSIKKFLPWSDRASFMGPDMTPLDENIIYGQAILDAHRLF